jgi:hypothetical protein
VSQSKPHERMYKIVLHSKDASYDNHTTFTFRNVSIPFETIKGSCRIFVSSFHTIALTEPSYPFYINLEELSQPLSFDNASGTQSKTLFTMSGSQIESVNPGFGASISAGSINAL